MDFTLTDEQQAIADLAHRILSEQLPPERLRELEQTDAWFADDVWAELGQGRPPRHRASPRPTAAGATASSRPA